MRAKKILTALRGGRLRRDLRRALFTLVAFLVIAVPSSAVIEGMSASSIGDAAAQGLVPWDDDESFFGDEELLFGDDGGDIFDPDGGELDFPDWDIYEPVPDDVEDAGFAPEEDFFYEQETSDNLTADGIPFVAVQAYQKAESTSAAADPGCGVPWTLLAAIGRVESDHGRFGGSRLLSNGDGTKPIRGIPLDGRPGIARILDTDDGALDGDTTYDRAVGPMQFIPSTWRGVAVDGNSDANRDPNNIFDASLGAAGYLCSGPGNLRDPTQQAAAVRRYNHTDEYVRVVMSVAARYAGQSAGQPRVPQPAPPQPAPPTTPPAPRPAPPTTRPAPRPTPPAQAPAPPATQAPPPTTTPVPPPIPPEVDAPEVPETPDEPTPPGAPEVPEDTGIPTDPTQDDVPVGDELPPAAVGWSGTMLEFVTETLAERTECAPEDGGEAPEAGTPCPIPDAPAEGGDEGQGAVATLSATRRPAGTTTAWGRPSAVAGRCQAGHVISTEDFLWYVDQALDGMVAIVTELGDDLANRRPDLPGANSPYVLLHHCLGVTEHWAGHVVAGRTVERDRDAEFRASGPVDELVARARRAREQLAADLAGLVPSDPPRGATDPEDADLPLARTQGGALVHVYEELAQHRGQMEGCRDVLLAPWARTTGP